ncbi:Lrp/AsnC family transcriptional regulator [Brevibacillus composti]|uniref:Lrp/AsnC family transcriptional regulator n=1 Tax=Brevibacillus composti TaxID=2796470 RepID=A0A7T5EM00_9BACL|nr:Lrp/AsnC family transcriptional regulator [Brevibacillus composti]QQE75070.1 Lrp/AsnC family transcriptional regulator [Brevibacillus composti]QUO42156.1 Lrp/AsnC family transcriptional regulator [Brevibacillus composti]
MDSVDKEILLILQEQARISMTELGKMVGLSQPAVTERVRRLEERGVIREYRAVVSPEKANKQVSAYLLFHTKRCEKFIEFCREYPDVIELHRISGQYNYLLKVVTDSMQTLESFINESGVHGDSTTLIVMSSPIEARKISPSIAEA